MVAGTTLTQDRRNEILHALIENAFSFSDISKILDNWDSEAKELNEGVFHESEEGESETLREVSCVLKVLKITRKELAQLLMEHLPKILATELGAKSVTIEW